MTKRKTTAAEEKNKPKPKPPANKRGKTEAEAPTPAPPPKATPKATPRETKTRKRPGSNPPPASVAPEPVPAFKPESSALERKRLEVAEDLRKVETQIYDLETKYLDSSSAYGNAVRGYEGFLGGAGVANRKLVIKPEERLFSSSSATGQASAR